MEDIQLVAANRLYTAPCVQKIVTKSNSYYTVSIAVSAIQDPFPHTYQTHVIGPQKIIDKMHENRRPHILSNNLVS